jgi:hypothetical protein
MVTDKLTTVDRFGRVADFQEVDRLPVVEWAGYWNKTVDRWRGEGLPDTVANAFDIRAYFGLDRWQQFWIRARGPETPRPPSHGAPIIRSRDEFRSILPTLFRIDSFTRGDIHRWADEHARGETLVWTSLDGFFWFPRQLFGIEQHFYAFYDEPELMHEMNKRLLDYNLEVIEWICRSYTPEFTTIAEDMSYNHGPMLSRALFDEFLAPYYRELTVELRRRGIRVVVDSDGDVTEMVPWLSGVGVDGILPLERMAGVDVAELRRRHPRFLMIGAFDKTVMKHGEAAMRREFTRLLPTMRSGGFIPSVDHQTPPDVSIDTYRLYVRLLKEYAGIAARAAEGCGGDN